MALMANGVMRMAQYRTLKMDFWSDPFIEDLPYMGKYVYLYLITSPHTNNLGILDISRKKIAYETGMTVEDVETQIEDLRSKGKLFVDGTSILLINFIKNQTYNSQNMKTHLYMIFPLVESRGFRAALLGKYPFLGGKTVDDSQKGIGGVSIPLQGVSIPIEGDGIPLRENELEVEYEVEREVEEEKEKDLKDCGAVAPLCSAPHADSPKLKPKPRGIDCPCSDIAELWNEICTSLPRVVELSETRKKAIKARWKENPLRQNLDWWRELFSSIESSDFLTGRTGKGGRFGFDWFLSPKNIVKTVEGNYANDRSLRGADIPFDAIQAAWNETLVPRGKPPVTEMHAERRAGVSRIWTGVPRWNSLDTWKKFFVWLSADKGFLDLSGCGFDWLLIYENFVKVREQTYGKSG